MRPFRSWFRGQGVFFAFQSWAGCITNIFGFDLRQAQLKLLRKLLKKMAFVPDKLVTDDLRSYGAAARELGCLVAMSAGDGAITERRTRINRPDDGSARCRGSRVRDQPNDFCPSTPPPTTPSTSSVTSSQRRHTGHSEPRPCRRGAR